MYNLPFLIGKILNYKVPGSKRKEMQKDSELIYMVWLLVCKVAAEIFAEKAAE